jgi:hypothetical protein
MVDPYPTQILPTVLPVRRDLGFAYGLSVLLAGLLVVTSVAGLLFGSRGLYTPDPQTLPTFLGQDGMTLLVGLPLLVGSLWLTRQGSLRGLLLWLGSLFSFAYSYAFYVLSPEFNVLYPLYLAIVSMSAYSGLFVLLSIDAEALQRRFSPRTPVRLAGGFLAVMAVVIAAKWLGMIVSDLTTGAIPARVDQVVWPMDLVLAFPAMFWGGVWLWRRQPLGYLVAAPLLVKATTVGLTLVVNTWLVTRWGVPPDPMFPVYVAVGLGGLVLLVWYLRAVVTFQPSPPSVPQRCPGMDRVRAA